MERNMKLSRSSTPAVRVGAAHGGIRLFMLTETVSMKTDTHVCNICNQQVSDDTNDSKNDARISSIRNLLALLSSARFYTLYEVVKHISK